MDVRTGFAKTGGSDDLEIYYEDMGDPNDPAVLLIMGLGAQLLLWRKGFCEKLVDQGLRVIRYDNRDVGLSSKVTGRHTGAALLPRMVRSFLGKPSPAVYTLEDMADDAAALLDHLDIERAHIVGASMGGMIAQIFAARFPHRTRTLGLIFSSNNQAFLPPPGLQAAARPAAAARRTPRRTRSSPTRCGSARSSAAPATRDPRTSCAPTPSRATSGPTTPQASPATSPRSSAAAACCATTARSRAPTVVIHGRADKLMRPFGGRAIARAISGARLVLIDGMAHDLPEQLWDEIVSELKTNFAEPA